MMEPSEYDVKYLSSDEIKGKLLFYPDKIVFEPKEEYEEKIVVPIPKIRDVRFTTEKDISALDVFLLGPTLGVLAKHQHKMITIDYDDEFGIIQHLTFEGGDMEEAYEELYEIRKAEKTGITETTNPPETETIHCFCPRWTYMIHTRKIGCTS
jgi:hypothetical protein